MRRATSGRGSGGYAGRLWFLTLIAAMTAGCSVGDSGAGEAGPATSAVAQTEDPEWRLSADAAYGSSTTLWIDMNRSTTLSLLSGVNASDVHSWHLDDLSDDEGLGAADTEVKILKKPKHGAFEFNVVDATVAYAPYDGFRGEDTVKYSVKLKNQPEIVELTHTITVELSPGGEYRRTHKYENCAEARAAGDTPVRKGEPGYGPHLDADGDGIGCDWG